MSLYSASLIVLFGITTYFSGKQKGIMRGPQCVKKNLPDDQDHFATPKYGDKEITEKCGYYISTKLITCCCAQMMGMKMYCFLYQNSTLLRYAATHSYVNNRHSFVCSLKLETARRLLLLS